VIELEIVTVHPHANGVVLWRIREGDERGVGDRLRTSARLLLRRGVGRREGVRHRLVVRAVRVVDAERPQLLEERALGTAERHAVLRPARPRKRRFDVAEVE